MEVGTDEIKKIDDLFKSYNYDLRTESNNQVRIYTLRYGMYHAAEILTLNGVSDAAKYKQEYSDLGYATEVKKYENIAVLDSYLFDGFFIKTPLGLELKKRYAKFVGRQVQHLPEKSIYNYIDCAFDLIFEDENNLIKTKSYVPTGAFDQRKSCLVDTVENYLNTIDTICFQI